MLDVTDGFIIILGRFELFVADITNGLIVGLVSYSCALLLQRICFVCQVDSGSWDTEIQDDVGLHMRTDERELVGRLPFVFLYV